MIKTITEEQRLKIPEYVDRWVSYASSPVDFLKAKESIEKIYLLMGKKNPSVLIAKGPIDAFYSAVAIQLLCGDKKAIPTLYSTLRSTLYSTLGSTNADDKVKDAMKKAHESLSISQWWGFWAAYYDYAEMIGVKFEKEKKEVFHDFCREVPLIYCMDGLAIICHKPKISWREL